MKSILALVPALCFLEFVFPAAPPHFVKVSPHSYFFQSAGDEANVSAVITDDGVALIDAQREKNVPQVLDALKKITAKPVNWVVNTCHHEDHTGGNTYFLTRNVAVIGSRRLLQLHAGLADETEKGAAGRERIVTHSNWPLRFSFERMMHLFPGGLEMRISAVGNTGQAVVFLPGERVLYVGDLYLPGSYPVVDSVIRGSALAWLDGTKDVVEAIRLLKSAMPQTRPSPATAPAPEKTLEEAVVVIPGHGPASNLRELKNLLETSQKLRAEITRAITIGRSRDAMLSSALDSFRAYKNLEAFASQLYDDLARK